VCSVAQLPAPPTAKTALVGHTMTEPKMTKPTTMITSRHSKRTSNSPASVSASQGTTTEESIRVNITAPTDLSNNATANAGVKDSAIDQQAADSAAQGEDNDVLNSIIAHTDASGKVQYDARADERTTGVHAMHTRHSTATGGSSASNQSSNSYQPAADDDSWAAMFYRLVCCSLGSAPGGDGYASASAAGEGFEPALPPQTKRSKGKICLVLDLDETLVHSSFKPVENPDFM
jgi:hypothetical protein